VLGRPTWAGNSGCDGRSDPHPIVLALVGLSSQTSQTTR